MAISSTNVAFSGTATSIYASPSGQENAVTTMFFCNTTSGDITLSAVHLVPSSGSAGATNKILIDLLIPAKETFTFETEKIILGAGDSIYAVATATGLTATVCTLRVS